MVKFEQPIHKFGATHLEERVGVAIVQQLRRVSSSGATFAVQPQHADFDKRELVARRGAERLDAEGRA